MALHDMTSGDFTHDTQTHTHTINIASEWGHRRGYGRWRDKCQTIWEYPAMTLYNLELSYLII